jgi:hypothetical protein
MVRAFGRLPTPAYVVWGTCQEEAPLLELSALFGQVLEIPQLADGHPPYPEHKGMDAVVLQGEGLW